MDNLIQKKRKEKNGGKYITGIFQTKETAWIQGNDKKRIIQAVSHKIIVLWSLKDEAKTDPHVSTVERIGLKKSQGTEL